MVRFLMLVAASGFLASGFAGSIPAAEPLPQVAADKKVRASVTGVGKSRFEAESDADRNARKVSGGVYSRISRTTNGSGTNYVCTMVIEYRQR